MKKILILCFIAINLLNASGIYDKRVDSFREMIEDKNYDTYLSNAYKDTNWIEANKAFDKKKEVKIINKKELIPDWKTSLELLKKSSNTNIIAAYQGAYTLENSLMAFKTTNKDTLKYIKENSLIFINPLMEKNYCYGYYVASKYYLRYSKDYKKGFDIAEKGLNVCDSIDSTKINMLSNIKQEHKLNYYKLYHLTHKPKSIYNNISNEKESIATKASEKTKEKAKMIQENKAKENIKVNKEKNPSIDKNISNDLSKLSEKLKEKMNKKEEGK